MRISASRSFIAVALAAIACQVHAQQPAPPSAPRTNAQGKPGVPPNTNVPDGFFPPAPAKPRPPVFILLNSRFTDHTHPERTLERIHRLLPFLRELNRQNPSLQISDLFEFSGSVAEVLSTMGEYSPILQEIKAAAQEGIIHIGYAGEEEPSPYNRPAADFLTVSTVEERWLARTKAASIFLTDYKDPITGDPIPGLTGGAKRVQEVLGNPEFLTGTNLDFGDNSPIQHELRHLNDVAVMAGIPDPETSRGIPEYRSGMQNFGTAMSPIPNTSPELYFEDNVLHVSDAGAGDLRNLSAASGLQAIEGVLTKLKRTRPRVVKLEVGSYLAYLKRNPDGSASAPPLQWVYTHPNAPQMPSSMDVATTLAVESAWSKEEGVLRWVVSTFMKDNPGSQFVSPGDLKKLTINSVGAEISAQDLQAAAEDLVNSSRQIAQLMPNFAFTGREYFSLADMFQMLTTAFAHRDASSGAMPAKVRLTNVYGPLDFTSETGPASGEVSVEDIAAAARSISDGLNDDAWKPVPSNAVPTWLTVGGTRITGSQFLNLMAQAYLNPAPGAQYKLVRLGFFSTLGVMHPRHLPSRDFGNSWTFKPAFLNPELLPGLPQSASR